MEWGMKNRLAQLIKSDGRCLFLPIDHGYFQGPTRKLEKPGETIRPLLRYCDALFVTRGVVRSSIDPETSIRHSITARDAGAGRATRAR